MSRATSSKKRRPLTNSAAACRVTPGPVAQSCDAEASQPPAVKHRMCSGSRLPLREPLRLDEELLMAQLLSSFTLNPQSLPPGSIELALMLALTLAVVGEVPLEELRMRLAAPGARPQVLSVATAITAVVLHFRSRALPRAVTWLPAIEAVNGGGFNRGVDRHWP